MAASSCIERKPDPLTGDERTCISIFMNVFSVHVNRSPVTGVVEQIRYWPGKFVNAAYDKAATDNERCGYLLRGEDGAAWTMVQIAGSSPAASSAACPKAMPWSAASATV